VTPAKVEVTVALWGVLGGIVRALDTAVREHRVPAAGLLVANVAIAGFCGFLCSSLAEHFDPKWSTVAAGIGGYLGTTVIDVIVQLLTLRAGGK
jgi:fluoride ion exporter CrcB/FEX